MVQSHIELELAKEKIILMPQRALYWPRKKWLAVSDLHWGKTEVFHRYGIRIPDGVLAADLKRLSEAITLTAPERLLILGDLIHHRSGINEALQSAISGWRKNFDLPMVLIEGNHDRGAETFLASWAIEKGGPSLASPPFVFSHDRRTKENLFCISGHVHPVIRMRFGADKLRAPCFYIQEQNLILPAFSSFTGGEDMRKEAGSRVFPILEDKGPTTVIEF